MATHSSVLAWRIPGEPGGLPSMGSHRVGHDWSELAAQQIAFSGERYSESKNWVYPRPLLLGIIASRPLLWTESGNNQFLKNEFIPIPPIHIHYHNTVLYLSSFNMCISLLQGKSIAYQHQCIIHMPCPIIHTKNSFKMNNTNTTTN